MSIQLTVILFHIEKTNFIQLHDENYFYPGKKNTIIIIVNQVMQRFSV